MQILQCHVNWYVSFGDADTLVFITEIHFVSWIPGFCCCAPKYPHQITVQPYFLQEIKKYSQSSALFLGNLKSLGSKKSHSRLLHGSVRHKTGPNLLVSQEHTSTSQCNSHLITKVVSAFFVSSENYTVGGVPF